MVWPKLIVALRLRWGSRGCQGSEAAGEMSFKKKKKKRLKELSKNGENLLLRDWRWSIFAAEEEGTAQICRSDEQQKLEYRIQIFCVENKLKIVVGCYSHLPHLLPIIHLCSSGLMCPLDNVLHVADGRYLYLQWGGDYLLGTPMLITTIQNKHLWNLVLSHFESCPDGSYSIVQSNGDTSVSQNMILQVIKCTISSQSVKCK